MVGLYQPLADGSGYRLVITCPLPDQTCLLQSLQKTKRSVVRTDGDQNPTLHKTFFFGFWVPHPASDLQKIEHKNAEPTKHKKAGGVKTASLRTAR
ncbi:hypothetical protein PWP93_13965 [Paraburkholderia sp. A1RI-2L]|uniref:hypothetical protein n=1 Tax=unclassified Paraburkholderia TaxID=2615204 RepID=UPI002ABE88C9|nr:hypothetical protein [Paraburkholderia sp. J63]